MQSGYPLDHIGIAVPDLETALAKYQADFGFQVSMREEVVSQKVELAFLEMPGTKIELLMPTSAESPLQKFLDKRGAGLHHICYRVDDIRAELTRLAQLGHTLIDKEPRPGAHSTLIAFLHPKSTQGVLTELCEYP